MITDRVPIERFHPGEFVLEEIEERGWAQIDLAAILGRPVPAINEIITGKRGITPETAHGLAAAFGTSAEYWMNLETQYQLWNSKHLNKARHMDVSRKARLYEVAPIKHMVKRGWIDQSNNVEVLERAVLDFFGCETLEDEIPGVPFAAKMSISYAQASTGHKAWVYRAANIARAIQAKSFTTSSIASLKLKLKNLLHEPQEIRHVPKLMAEHGIRLVIVEHLPRTKIDGAAFWLDDASPVIVLSLRYDRIDNFWFVLMHEIDHISHKDTISAEEVTLTDVTEGGQTKPIEEARANDFAAGFLVPRETLQGFINRKSPLFNGRDIANFAATISVHPGLVAGQLNHLLDDYTIGRRFLVKVRYIMLATALTDGWGQSVEL